MDGSKGSKNAVSIIILQLCTSYQHGALLSSTLLAFHIYFTYVKGHLGVDIEDRDAIRAWACKLAGQTIKIYIIEDIFKTVTHLLVHLVRCIDEIFIYNL